jgi:hypothetical protein
MAVKPKPKPKRKVFRVTKVEVTIHHEEEKRRKKKMSLQVGQQGPAAAAIFGGIPQALIVTLPAGASIDWESDNTAVATVVENPNNPLQAQVTAVSVGTANISATVTNADGTTATGSAVQTVTSATAPVVDVTSVTVTTP